METQEKIVNRYVEKPVKTKNGFAMLALILLLFFGSIAAMVCGPVFLSATNVGAAVAIAIAGALVLIFDLFLMPGLKILNPNEALVLTLFGKYHGTLKGDGYFWVNPFCEGINPGAQGSSILKLFGMTAAVGFALAIVLFSGVRERTAGNDIPAAFRGFPFALISASLLALAFTGFSGLSLPL